MRLLIYGAKDFARTAAELATHCGHTVAGFIDDFERSPRVIGSFDETVRTTSPADSGIVLAVGYRDLAGRWTAWQRIRAAGFTLPSLVHPRAYVADSARVGEGCMVMAGAIVDVRVTLGDGVVVWPGACVNHDSVVGDNTFVSPNATICGHVQIGAHCFIGAGAAIADHRTVPERSFVRMLAMYPFRDSM
jgi:sugar O-acyltransferase (sialic acid O-acetyltransferase NeuD family)